MGCGSCHRLRARPAEARGSREPWDGISETLSTHHPSPYCIIRPFSGSSIPADVQNPWTVAVVGLATLNFEPYKAAYGFLYPTFNEDQGNVGASPASVTSHKVFEIEIEIQHVYVKFRLRNQFFSPFFSVCLPCYLILLNPLLRVG